MKHFLFTATCILLTLGSVAQTLTLVTNKRLYEHHSTALSNLPYGNANVNTQSGYDFVTHSYVAAGTASLAGNRDLVEHNGYYGYNGSSWGWQFGFTSGTSYLGFPAYQGNNTTRFYLNNSVNFANLTTVNDLISAYNSTLATSGDTAVSAGDIFITRVRNTNMYLAMRITTVSNLTAAQVTALDNNQQINADVYFDFEYKYGTLCVAPSVSVASSQGTICAGSSATLTAMGANSYTWTHSGNTATTVVQPAMTSTYVVSGSNGSCAATASIVQTVKICTDIFESDEQNRVNVFPNPANDFLYVKMSSGCHLSIYNAEGSAMIFTNRNEDGMQIIDLQNFPAGIYMLNFFDGAGLPITTKKLLKL